MAGWTIVSKSCREVRETLLVSILFLANLSKFVSHACWYVFAESFNEGSCRWWDSLNSSRESPLKMTTTPVAKLILIHYINLQAEGSLSQLTSYG